MSDIIDRSTTTIMGILIAVILVCSALIPIAIDQIAAMKARFTEQQYGADIVAQISQYADIIFIVILLVIIALIIGVVKTYTNGSERD